MNNAKSLAPFSCQYTPQVPELLQHLNCSIAISTYQAGKIVFISDDKRINIENLENGIYSLELINKEGITRKKFIKE